MKLTSKTFGVGVSLICCLALHGQTLNTLYSFDHNEFGYQPRSGVVIGAGGELYGTATFGGAYGEGLLFELVPPSSPGLPWSEVVLHSFNPNSEGGCTSLLTLGPSGVLYGSTLGGYTEGTVFQLTPPQGSSAHWRDVTLHAFSATNGDGTYPQGPVVMSAQGALYGTTAFGGANNNGTVYRLVPPSAQGGAWSEQILYNFDYKADAEGSPSGTLALGSNDVLYGTTEGTVFQLAPPTSPGGPWAEKTLHDFSGSADPYYANGVVLGPNGVLYGTAAGSTLGPCTGCGSVFQLAPPTTPGGSWTETVLHLFTGGNYTEDGTVPDSTPVLGPNGVLYGTTYGGGLYDLGTVYELLPPSSPGGAWTEVTLYSFTDGPDGGEPMGVALGPDGNLYGTTQIGGVSPHGILNQGTVFELVLPQNANNR